MNDREKLIKLLHKSADILINTPVEGYTERLADYLIANGVVIQKQGEWVEHIETLVWCEDDVDVFYKCSKCGTHSPDISPYCPNCGAKMKEVK